MTNTQTTDLRLQKASCDAIAATVSDFALSEAELIDRIVDLTLERDSYRLLTQRLLHELNAEQRAHLSTQRRYNRLRAERPEAEEWLDRFDRLEIENNHLRGELMSCLRRAA